MIRIVGVQPTENIAQEFVLLQNQGNMRINLRGYALIAEQDFSDPPGLQAVFVINEDIDVPPGHHAAIRTAAGTSGWCHKHDGYHVYHFFLGRSTSIWRAETTVHLLTPTHRYATKKVEVIPV